jgi:DNA-binding response OmpR family regulator
MSVLIVEDEEAILNGLIAALTPEYTVIVAQTSQDAVRQFTDYRHYIDLLISDVSLSAGLSGVELARRFREEVAGLPVILISARQPSLWSERDTSNLNWLGPHSLAFLQKPFSVAELLANTRRLMRAEHAPLRATRRGY